MFHYGNLYFYKLYIEVDYKILNQYLRRVVLDGIKIKKIKIEYMTKWYSYAIVLSAVIVGGFGSAYYVAIILAKNGL